MLIKLKSIFSEKEIRTAEYLESIERPLLLVNEELAVIARNSLAAERFPELSAGRGLYFLFGKHARRVCELMPCQVMCAELKVFGTPCAVTIIGGVERRVVLFDSIETRIEKTVFDAYGKMSGYDLVLKYPEYERDDDSPILTMRLNEEDADFLLRVLNSRKSTRELSPFNAGAVISAVIEELGCENFGASSKNADINALGSERDLAIVAALMLSFFKRNRTKDLPEIKVFFDHLSVCFCVEGAIDIKSEEAELLFGKRANGARLSGALSDERFWFYLMRLLVEMNLWEQKAEYKNGVLSLSLILPAAEQSARYVLRDKISEAATKAAALFGKRR